MRAASVCVLVAAACSTASAPLTPQPNELRGPERLSIDPGLFVLAPGRDSWLMASTFIVTSPTSMSPVIPKVTFESSNPRVAIVTVDSGYQGRVVAKAAGTATITVRSLRDPKNVATARVTVQPAPVGNDAGLAFSATARLVPSDLSSSSSPLGPAALQVVVTMSNPTTQPRDIWLSGCPAWIRLYKSADYSGSPLVNIPRGVYCSVDPVHHALAPAASEQFDAEGFRLTLQGQSLPVGTYYAVAALDRLRDLHEVRAGPIVLVDPNAGLIFSATTSSSDGQIRPQVSFTNTNTQPVRLEYGACAITLLAYRSATRSGVPAWNSSRWQGPNGFGHPCLLYLATGVLDPGQTASLREFSPTFSAAEMLGDSLAAGRYYFKVLAGLNWRSVEVVAGEALVAK
jgi:hypothetical protein